MSALFDDALRVGLPIKIALEDRDGFRRPIVTTRPLAEEDVADQISSLNSLIEGIE